MQLLTTENAKTTKGEKLNIRTGILYLAPANESGVINMCGWASDGCTDSCVYRCGRSEFDPHIAEARIARTLFLVNDRAAFLAQLEKETEELIRYAVRHQMKPAIRPNGTSDQVWIAHHLAKKYYDVQFYDYTKRPRPWLYELANYHLTFSLSEKNWDDSLEALNHGFNLAVPFSTAKKQGYRTSDEALPTSWRGYPVIDGDQYDCRFLDGHQGAVIGLRQKGNNKVLRAKGIASGFVQIAPVGAI